MTVENQQQLDQSQWVKEQHGDLLSYCSRNDLKITNIIQKDSAILPPIAAVWLVDSKQSAQQFWVITGDLPNDHIQAGNAVNAREALRHFSLRWQLKSEKILNSLESRKADPSRDNTEKEFADLLISRAEGLFELFENKQLW